MFQSGSALLLQDMIVTVQTYKVFLWIRLIFTQCWFVLSEFLHSWQFLVVTIAADPWPLGFLYFQCHRDEEKPKLILPLDIKVQHPSFKSDSL